MNLNLKKGFTLVEIMIVVMIIAVILAVAVPGYFKSSQKSQKTICMANLEKIDAAISQWALENHASSGTVVSGSAEEDIYTNYLKGGKPQCPSGGEYTLHSVGDSPQVTCSKADEGHELP